ncbi:hypothetical protein, partial [Paraburkholderia sp. RL17-347-BIC-D]|uniref:hypothetical protein n=1 Tax=Paraburkholderia sp. RL17-347-BIC-D TaxID=3031632 RepID=UPI0038BD2165
PDTASFCVAASAAEKRDYEELSLRRQQVFSNFLNLPTSLKALPLLALPPPVPRCPEHERARF